MMPDNARIARLDHVQRLQVHIALGADRVPILELEDVPQMLAAIDSAGGDRVHRHVRAHDQQPVRGLVLLSLNDSAAGRIVLGSGHWRWSDLLFARGNETVSLFSLPASCMTGVAAGAQYEGTVDQHAVAHRAPDEVHAVGLAGGV